MAKPFEIKKEEIKPEIELNNKALSLVQLPGSIHWQLVTIPFDAVTGTVGKAEFTNLGTERSEAESRFKIAVVENKILN